MRKVLAGALLGCGILSSMAGGHQGKTAASIVLQEHRGSGLDLAIAGELPGVPHGAIRYVSREELSKLPQVTYRVSDDPNFKGTVEVSGVLLEDLTSALGASSESNFVVAVCADQYHGNFSSEYLREHHPVLVLKIDGQPPKGSMAPYLISHAKFTPSFKILSHQDEAQIPWAVERLEFRDERKTFAAIAPRGPHASDASVQAGYRIAAQNCFRCHNMGEEGGTQSRQPWLVLAAWAAADPEHFASYVRNPQAKNPNTQMAASPQYDDVTMKALTDYFSTFIATEKP